MATRSELGRPPRRLHRIALQAIALSLGAVAIVLGIRFLTDTGASEGEAGSGIPPAVVEHVEGGLSRVQLSQEAADRIGLQTAAVEDARGPGTKGLTVVPYSALLYDAQGHVWVYTSPEPLTFVRARVTVETVSGKRAFISRGPAEGTTVASVGAAELYGTEFEVGH